jgi:hypothetical protein
VRVFVYLQADTDVLFFCLEPTLEPFLFTGAFFCLQPELFSVVQLTLVHLVHGPHRPRWRQRLNRLAVLAAQDALQALERVPGGESSLRLAEAGLQFQLEASALVLESLAH